MDQARLSQIMKMLENNPDDSFLNFAAALEFKKNHRREDAIRLLEKLLERDEKYLSAYLHLGKMYELNSEPEKAKNIFLKGKAMAGIQKDMNSLAEMDEALQSLGMKG